jgi:G3E family GTPase
MGYIVKIERFHCVITNDKEHEQEHEHERSHVQLESIQDYAHYVAGRFFGSTCPAAMDAVCRDMIRTKGFTKAKEYAQLGFLTWFEIDLEYKSGKKWPTDNAKAKTTAIDHM